MTKDCRVRSVRLDSSGRYQRLFSEDSGTLGVKSGHVILKPGESIGEHTTAEREEIIIILKGQGGARVGTGGVLKIEKETVLYIPPQTLHDIENTGTDILEYIFVTSKI